MTDPLFLHPLTDPLPSVGALVELTGSEGHHAAVVRRIQLQERITLSDGAGRAVSGPVIDRAKNSVTIEVAEQLSWAAPAVRLVAVQALAKGDRSELAVEMLTEIGICAIIPWQATRSIVRWDAARAAKALGKWRSTAREATKQSRRLVVPDITEPITSAVLTERLTESALALVLHEEAAGSITEVVLPEAGEVMIIIGPEGGITAEELDAFTRAGAQPVRISEAVLRTSTAGVVAATALQTRGIGRSAALR